MAQRTQKALWGPQLTSYDLRLQLVDLECCFNPLIELDCFDLDNPSFSETAELVSNCNVLINGKLQPRETVAVPAIVKRTSYDLRVPEGYVLWNVLQTIAGQNCPFDVVLSYLCPERVEYEHSVIMQGATLSSFRRDGKLVEARGNDPAFLDLLATLSFNSEVTYYTLFGELVHTDAEADGVYAIDWNQAACQDCVVKYFQDAIYGDDNGSIYSTDDRFASVTNVSPTLPALSVVTSICAFNDTYYATYADTVDPSTMATGGLATSADGGNNWTDLSTNGFAGVVGLKEVSVGDDHIVAVGENTGSLGLQVSSDGTNFAASAAAALTGLEIFYSVSYSASLERFVIVGDTGAGAGIVYIYDADNDVISNVTASIAGAVTSINQEVWVSGDYVAIAQGITDSLIEIDKFNLADQCVGTRILPGATGTTVEAIDGDCFRVWLGRGTKLYYRQLDKGRGWREADLNLGSVITGDIVDIALGTTSETNGWLLVSTDNGEIFVFRPPFPNS